VTDAGTVDEDSQFVRIRALTTFGELKLVAAGERRDQGGVVPVDATPEGWADTQNQNIQRLMLLIRRLSTSGRTLYVDQNRGRTNDVAQAQDDPANIVRFPGPDTAAPNESGMRAAAVKFGDFSTVGEALAYASACVARGEPALSSTDPYIIVIRPGIYLEDLSVPPWVFLQGAGDSYWDVRIITTDVGRHHTLAATGAGSYFFLDNLYLANGYATTSALLEMTGGSLVLRDAYLQQTGADANQGGCINVAPGFDFDIEMHDSKLEMAHGSPLYAITVSNPAGRVAVCNSEVRGPSGVFCLADPAGPVSNTQCFFTRSTITGTDDAGYSFRGYPALASVRSTQLDGPFSVDPVGYPAGSFTHDIDVSVHHSDLVIENAGATFALIFDPSGTTGACTLHHGAVGDQATTVVHDFLSIPSAPGTLPGIWPDTQSYSLFFNNDYTRPEAPGSGSMNPIVHLPTNNVQEALSMLVRYALPLPASPFYSLESAYNGLAALWPPTPGSGLGRTIEAGAGAVQITRAVAPAVPFEPLLLGGLQVEGQVDIGPLKGDGLGSEFCFNPNTFGMGPILKLGHSIIPNVAGMNSCALVEVGRRSSTGFDFTVHPRNITSVAPGGRAGNVALHAGSMNSAAAFAGAAYLQAGDVSAALPGGAVWLAPGYSSLTPGRVQITELASATFPILTAAGPFVPGPAAGYFYIETINGVERHQVLAGDTVVALATRINVGSTAVVATVVAGTILRLTGVNRGPTAFILYMADDQLGAVNTKIGDLRPSAGAAYTPGAYGNYCGISCTGANHIHVHGQITADVPIVPGAAGYQHMPPAAPIAAGVLIVGVDITAGAITVNLPVAPAAATQLVIKHEAGSLGVNPLTIDPGAANIDNVAGPRVYNNALDNNFSLSLYYAGATGWYII